MQIWGIEMAHTEFSERVSRLKSKGAPQSVMVPLKDAPRVLAEPVRANWQIVLGLVLGLILVPLGFAARIDTQVVMAPGLNAAPAYYLTAMGFALGFHLILSALVIVAIAQRFKKQFLNIVVFEMLVGYGLASAFLTFAGG